MKALRKIAEEKSYSCWIYLFSTSQGMKEVTVASQEGSGGMGSLLLKPWGSEGKKEGVTRSLTQVEKVL